MIEKLIIILLTLLIASINKLDNSIKLKIYMILFNSIISKVIILNIIFFSVKENFQIGTLLTILLFMILSFDKSQIREDFISYYKKY